MHTLFISATFGGIFGLCMGGSVISVFEIFYRLFLVMITMAKTLLRLRMQQPRENVVLPWNIRTFAPYQADVLFHRTRYKNARQY
jgi:hypothetical protein